MTTTNLPPCSVLLCGNDGAAPITNEIPWDVVETVVCAEHKAEIDAGAPWDWDVYKGRVLMGNALAPLLTEWSMRDSSGTRGMTLTLEADPDRKFSVFLTPKDIDQLQTVFKSRGTASTE